MYKIEVDATFEIYFYGGDDDQEDESRRQGRQGAVSIDDSDPDNEIDFSFMGLHRQASLCWRRSFLDLIASRLRRRNVFRTDPLGDMLLPL